MDYQLNGKTYKESDLEDMDVADLEILLNEIEKAKLTTELEINRKQHEWKSGIGPGLDPVSYTQKEGFVKICRIFALDVEFQILVAKRDYSRTWMACAEEVLGTDELDEIDKLADIAMERVKI